MMSDATGAITIKLTNDFTRMKEDFVPCQSGRVTLYVCGVTVYDECHIGHARAYVCFDVVRRWLEYRGFNVFHIQNFTDVDDKIIQRANERGVHFLELANRYIKEYFEVMDALGIKRAAVYPRATEYIGKMIGVIEKLVEKGHAYAAGGNVFFDVSSYPNYGKMSNVDLSEKKLTKEDEGLGKRNAADFALWKAAKEGEPSWDSPWGAGRPGWHIECSTMSTQLAGPTLDIHGGGHDLIFPHHENEIAQAECYTGEKFVRYWMHNGFVEMAGDKMSKSLGNVITARELLKNDNPDAVRLFFLSAHYKMPVTYTEERLAESEKGLARFDVFFAKVADVKRRAAGEGGGDAIAGYAAKIESAREAFIAAMDDDFNTPVAVAELFSIVRTGNTLIADIEAAGGEPGAAETIVFERAKEIIIELGGAVGLFQNVDARQEGESELLSGLMELLLRMRNEARAKKDWATADAIRDELARLGLVIEDAASGTTWRRA